MSVPDDPHRRRCPGCRGDVRARAASARPAASMLRSRGYPLLVLSHWNVAVASVKRARERELRHGATPDSAPARRPHLVGVGSARAQPGEEVTGSGMAVAASCGGAGTPCAPTPDSEPRPARTPTHLDRSRHYERSSPHGSIGPVRSLPLQPISHRRARGVKSEMWLEHRPSTGLSRTA